MTEQHSSPLWNVANGVITAMAAVLAFFGTQLWSQGQKIAELTSDSTAHQREDAKVAVDLAKIDDRQERNTKDVAALFGQNATQDAMAKAIDVRLDKIRGLVDAADARATRGLELAASEKDVDRLEKEIGATVSAQAGSIQAEITRLGKEVDRLNAELDKLRNPPH